MAIDFGQNVGVIKNLRFSTDSSQAAPPTETSETEVTTVTTLPVTATVAAAETTSNDKDNSLYNDIIKAARQRYENVYPTKDMQNYKVTNESCQYMQVMRDDILNYTGDKDKLDVYAYGITFTYETDEFYGSGAAGCYFDAKTGEYIGDTITAVNEGVQMKTR